MKVGVRLQSSIKPASLEKSGAIDTLISKKHLNTPYCFISLSTMRQFHQKDGLIK